MSSLQPQVGKRRENEDDSGAERNELVQPNGTRMSREAKRTKRLNETLPKGITLGQFRDGRAKPFFLRYGPQRTFEGFTSEEERNNRAEALAAAQRDHGREALRFDPAEWREFQEWKKLQRPTMSVKDAVEKYLALRLGEDVKKDSDTHLHLVLHLDKRFSGTFATRPLNEVTAEMVRAWLASLKNPKTGEPMSKVTVKHHRKDVNTFFARAVAEEWTTKNPCTAVKPPKIDEDDLTPLSPKEIFDLLKHNADEPVLGKMVLELFGGMRASSAGRLKREHLNFAEKGLFMPGAQHKSGSRKFRQGHPAVLWAWLEAAPDKAWELQPKNYARLKSLAFVRARVTNPGNALRHSFASYLLALLKDMGQVGYLMQHRNRRTTEGYEGIATEADAKLVMSMTPEAVRKAQDFETFRNTQTQLTPAK